MAKKIFLRDENNIKILPITRGELILDSSGKQAFRSNEFLATDSQPGLMSPADKQKLETVAGNTVDTELSNTSTNPVQNKVLTQIINSIREKYLKSAVVSGNKVTITDQSNNTVEFVNSTYQIVTNAVDGLVPKYDAVDGTIDAQTTDWVLTNHNGTLGWYKLPTAAFSSSSVQLFVGAKSTSNNNNSNSATTNGNTYLKLFDNSTLKNQYNIKGTGLTTVISDDSGTITINVPTSHNQASSDINSLTGYAKATAIAAIATTDSLNTALGKLELKADSAYELVKGAYDGDGTIENLTEILKVLEGIKDTETIQAIIGKYLPLTGGTLTGPLSFNDTASARCSPMIKFGSDNQDTILWKVYSSDSTYADKGVYGFDMTYKGTGTGDGNYLILHADNQNASSKVAAMTVTNGGYITLQKDLTIGTSDSNKTLYLNGNTSSLRLFAWSDATYIESGSSNFGANKPLYITGISGNNGSDLNLLFNNINANGTLRITPQLGNYQEGIRIQPKDSWSILMLLGTDTTAATSGTSAKSWGFFNNDGTLYINKATSSGNGNPRAMATSTGWTFGNTDTNSYALNTASFICDSWVRTKGATGWYNEDYGGGWYMTDGTYVRVYNDKRVYNNNTSQYAFYTAGGMTASGNIYAARFVATASNSYQSNGGLILSNADIWGLNAIYTADLADGASEGYQFKRTNGNYDSIWCKDGYHYFSPNGHPDSGYSANYPILVSSHDGNGYPVILRGDGTCTWIRVGGSDTYGILPYTSGGAGSGHSYIGTSSWYFKYAYIDNIYGTVSNVTVNSSDANSTYRMVWHSGNTLYGTGGIYCNPSTDYLYATSMNASDWFRSSGNTGWYNPTNSCHVYPNATTTYGGLMLRGEKGGYTGFILGTSTNYMNLMDNGTDKGLYQEGKLWILYYNRSSNYVGIRTSSLSDPLTVSGITRVVANGKYLRIGPQNGSHAHYETDAAVSHWFNKTIQVDGNIEPYGNNEHSAGSTSYRFSNVYSYLGNFAGTVTISCAYPNIVCNASSGSESNIRFEVGGANKGYVGFHNSYGTFLYNSTAGKYVYVNNSGYFYTQSYINVGAGNEKNASNPPYVWGVNGSDNFMRTYATSSLSVGWAAGASYAHYLPTKYDGGQQTNPQTYFNNGIGLRVAMTGLSSKGTSYWSDTLWINGYAGGDVPNMCALHFNRDGTPRAFISTQSSQSSSYGTLYELITGYNIGSQSVNYATYSRYVYCTSGSYLNFQWSGQSGQPTWLFGSNDGANVYVWNPSNFSVNYANSAGSATKATQDGNGNTISSYYVTLSTDQTITGKKTYSNVILFSGNDSYGIRTATNNYVRIGESSYRFYQCYVTSYYATSGFYQDSDIRLKNIVQNVEVNLDDLAKLQKVYYTWKSGVDTNKHIGMIAQEVQKLYPELVNKDEDTGYLSLAYDQLSVIALKAIDKLYAMIKDVQDENKQLKERLNQLENRIS